MVCSAVFKTSLWFCRPRMTPYWRPQAAHSLKSAAIQESTLSRVWPSGRLAPEKTRITGAPSLEATTVQSFTSCTSCFRRGGGGGGGLLRTPVLLRVTPLRYAFFLRLRMVSSSGTLG